VSYDTVLHTVIIAYIVYCDVLCSEELWFIIAYFVSFICDIYC